MKKLHGLVLALALLLAGCVSQDVPAAQDAEDDTSEPVYEDDRIRVDRLEPAEGEEIEPPTLAEAPKWRLGEWWEIALQDEFVGEAHRTTRVVAGSEDDSYLVGMPMHDFSNAIMVFHIPGFGQVKKSDLSFEIHDCPFEPLSFPLEEGKTWETEFECRPVTATVMEVTDTTAEIEIIGQGDHIELVYDAEMRAITSFRKEGYGSYEVTDHGWTFHEDKPGMGGQVTVPHGHDVIFMHGRIGGAVWRSEDLPTPYGADGPVDEVDVSSTYDRVSFAIILGNLVGDGAADGYYKEKATAPDGTVFELEKMPDEGAQFKIETFKHDAPGGVWTFEHLAAGPGIAMSEGIAYHVYDIVLPSGVILPSVGEHQHGDPCAHGC